MRSLFKKIGGIVLKVVGVALLSLGQKVIGDTMKEAVKEVLSTVRQTWMKFTNRSARGYAV